MHVRNQLFPASADRRRVMWWLFLLKHIKTDSFFSLFFKNRIFKTSTSYFGFFCFCFDGPFLCPLLSHFSYFCSSWGDLPVDRTLIFSCWLFGFVLWHFPSSFVFLADLGRTSIQTVENWRYGLAGWWREQIHSSLINVWSAETTSTVGLLEGRFRALFEVEWTRKAEVPQGYFWPARAWKEDPLMDMDSEQKGPWFLHPRYPAVGFVADRNEFCAAVMVCKVCFYLAFKRLREELFFSDTRAISWFGLKLIKKELFLSFFLSLMGHAKLGVFSAKPGLSEKKKRRPASDRTKCRDWLCRPAV